MPELHLLWLLVMGTLLTALTYGLQAAINASPSNVMFTNRTTLTGANPAPNPILAENLVVDGATLTGSPTISLRADLMVGRLIANDEIMITGDPTAYVVGSQVISPTTSDTLTAVPISPTLAMDAADGAIVSILPIAQTSLTALVTHFPAVLINGTTIMETDLRIVLLASSLPGITPIAGDLFLVEGFNREIIAVTPLSSQGSVYGFRCHVRG